MEENKLIIIAGPTAVGKTAFAIQFAEKYQLDIISADSRQVYQNMDIGTAKPTSNELSKIKHHLINIIQPDQQYNAGVFADDTSKIINSHIQEHKKLPMIVGGTGLYIKAFLEGLAPIPDIPAETLSQLRNEKETIGINALYERLKQVDKTCAVNINPNDQQRIIRFLSIFQATGKNFTYWKSQQKPKKHPFKVVYLLFNLDRDILYQRINKRVDLMIQSGLIDEVFSLLKQGYSYNSPGLNTLGYREFLGYFSGNSDKETCIELVKQHTRNFAKRQITWFKKEKNTILIDPSIQKFHEIEQKAIK